MSITLSSLGKRDSWIFVNDKLENVKNEAVNDDWDLINSNSIYKLWKTSANSRISYGKREFYSGPTDFLKTMEVWLTGVATTCLPTRNKKRAPVIYDRRDRNELEHTWELLPQKERRADIPLSQYVKDGYLASSGITASAKIAKNFKAKGEQLKEGTLAHALEYLRVRDPRFIYSDAFYREHSFEAQTEESIKGNILSDLTDKLEKNKERNIETRFIFVPIVSAKKYWFRSKPINHVTLLVMDRKKNSIFYYDSKGEKDLQSISLGKDLTVASMIETIKNTDSIRNQLFPNLDEGEEIAVHSNKDKHQIDSHNCGIFVLLMMMRILKLTEEEAISNLYTDSDKVYDYRDIEEDRERLGNIVVNDLQDLEETGKVITKILPYTGENPNWDTEMDDQEII